MLAYDHNGVIDRIDKYDFGPFAQAFHYPKEGRNMRNFIFLMSFTALSACDIPFVPFF